MKDPDDSPWFGIAAILGWLAVGGAIVIVMAVIIAGGGR